MALLSRAPAHFPRLLLFLGVAAVALPAGVRAQQTPGDLEQQIKAAYLLNFARYVDWPPGVFPSADDPINLCVVADVGMGEMVRSTVEGRRSRERPIRLIRPDSPTLAGDCHIAFLAGPPAVEEEWLAALRSSPALTVGEGKTFLKRGGMIAFVIVDQTVRFLIDAEAAQRAGLRISSRVLALALRPEEVPEEQR